MNEEMRGEVWRKAIPEDRDRVQSRGLVWVVGLLLAGLSFYTLRWTVVHSGQFSSFALGAFGLSVGFALVVRALRAATVGGAVGGGMICLLVTFWTGMATGSIVRSGLMPLVVLFLLTFLATRAGRRRKAKAGLAEGRRGRSAAQVIANLSVAGLCASLVAGWMPDGGFRDCWGTGAYVVGIGWVGWVVKAMVLAALVEATADTVSSEIGQAYGGQPVMLTTLRRVAVGTDGAVTVLGSAAGIAGGAVVAIAGAWAMHLENGAAGIALFAGVCGLFFDSLVGATLERRGWLGNDLVNFASTVFAAGVAAVECWALSHL
jgi:uncharacterized protein (TIGR00297 family)